MSLELIQKGLDSIEAKIAEFATKAKAETDAVGKVAHDTNEALNQLGIKQRELAEEIVLLKQRGEAPGPEKTKDEDWGEQFTKSDAYKAFAGGQQQKVRFEVKNTLLSSTATVAPDRRPGVVGGPFLPLTLESFLPSTTTTSNAIEFTKEDVFTNNAAEVAEGAQKPESALTWTLVTMPISTVAHWIKISRQLAMDNRALAAYVETRMRYGVNLRVEQQLVAGNGTSPNISGILDAGNFTAHGIADAALGATLKKLVLIRKMIANVRAAGYPADAILLNPADWAQIEIELLTTAAGQTLRSVNEAGVTRLFGLPVIESVGMTADQVAVGAFAQAYMLYNREGVVVEMSDSDVDNFTKNLITIRAERRLALATERPAAVLAGDLTPA
jgi:HK97 family phage major capsid protein